MDNMKAEMMRTGELNRIFTFELTSVYGDNTGSERGAKVAGRMVGMALFGPIGGIFYAGRDLGIW